MDLDLDINQVRKDSQESEERDVSDKPSISPTGHEQSCASPTGNKRSFGQPPPTPHKRNHAKTTANTASASSSDDDSCAGAGNGSDSDSLVHDLNTHMDQEDEDTSPDSVRCIQDHRYRSGILEMKVIHQNGIIAWTDSSHIKKINPKARCRHNRAPLSRAELVARQHVAPVGDPVALPLGDDDDVAQSDACRVYEQIHVYSSTFLCRALGT